MGKIAILIGKFILLIGNICTKIKLFKGKKFSVLPGKIAKKIDKSILSNFTLPKIIICVTGSSGKGSTVKLINNIFNDNGIDCIYNDLDSNVDTAIITMFLKNSNLFGCIKKDAMVLEIDERYAKYVFPYIKPSHVVITNITRDQPPRHGHFDLVAEEIKKALKGLDSTLILNGDDPYLQTFANNKVYFYGIDKNKFSLKNNLSKSLNLVYCPKCYNKLKYNYYHIESYGEYRCECGFERPKLDIIVSNLDYKKGIITFDNKYQVKCKDIILYSVNNIASAALVTSLFISKNNVFESINKINPNTVKIYNKKFKTFILNTKAENNTTYNQAIHFLNQFKEEKTLIIGWGEISRRYNNYDISWLYDIDFEIMKNVSKIICVGPNRFDILVRLKNSNLKARLIPLESVKELRKYIDKMNTFAILNFDYVKPFEKIVREVIK